MDPDSFIESSFKLLFMKLSIIYQLIHVLLKIECNDYIVLHYLTKALMRIVVKLSKPPH